jgi:hypothetical protein
MSIKVFSLQTASETIKLIKINQIQKMDAKTYFDGIRQIEQMPYETQKQINERIKARLRLKIEWEKKLISSAEECISQIDARNTTQNQ